jgi:hypothetical protein
MLMAGSQTEFPEPTRREALGLLVGATIGLAGYCAEGTTLTITHHAFASAFPLVALLSALVLAAGGFTFAFCAFQIAYRAQGTTFGRAFGESFRSRASGPGVHRVPPGLWRPLTPSYMRKAARSAGWNEAVAMVLLAALLMAALGTLVLVLTVGG